MVPLESVESDDEPSSPAEPAVVVEASPDVDMDELDADEDGEESGDDDSDDEDSPVVASATPGSESATPTPKATATAPTRPMYLAYGECRGTPRRGTTQPETIIADGVWPAVATPPATVRARTLLVVVADPIVFSYG